MTKDSQSILRGAREALAYAHRDHTGCRTTTYWIPGQGLDYLYLVPDPYPFEKSKPKDKEDEGGGGTGPC